MKTKIRYIFLMTLFIVLTSFDQYSKFLANKHLKKGEIPLIKDVFELYYHENNGAAWGIFSGKIPFLTIMTIVVMVGIVFLIIKLGNYTQKKYSFLQFFLVVLFSGAAGNLIDRIRLGYVVDYFYFKLINFPIFNVADCYVTVSVAAILFMILFVFSDDEINTILKK